MRPGGFRVAFANYIGRAFGRDIIVGYEAGDAGLERIHVGVLEDVDLYISMQTTAKCDSMYCTARIRHMYRDRSPIPAFAARP